MFYDIIKIKIEKRPQVMGCITKAIKLTVEDYKRGGKASLPDSLLTVFRFTASQSG